MAMGNKAKSGKAEGARCRRHRQQQGAGVCASCLRDRLSHLSSLSAASSLPSVIRDEEEAAERYRYGRYDDDDEEEASSCGSEASSTGYSSEGSSAASSECASPGGDGPAFHDEVRRAGRVSLLMRHERVVGDADAVAAFLRARREQRRANTSFWAKLLHATRGGGGGGKKDQGCSLAARGKTLEERAAAAKWVLF